LLNLECVFCFSLQRLSETFLIIRKRTERDMIKNVYWSSCKVVRFYRKLNFVDRFSKNIKYHI